MQTYFVLYIQNRFAGMGSIIPILIDILSVDENEVITDTCDQVPEAHLGTLQSRR